MAAQPARFPSGLSACYFLPLSSRLIWFLDCFLPWAMGHCAVSWGVASSLCSTNTKNTPSDRFAKVKSQRQSEELWEGTSSRVPNPEEGQALWARRSLQTRGRHAGRRGQGSPDGARASAASVRQSDCCP